MRRQILKRPLVFLMVQFIVSSITFRCARVHKNKPASSSQANRLLNPQRDKSMRVESVRAGSRLSHSSSPTACLKMAHTVPAELKLSYSNQALFHAQNVSCLASLIKLPFFFFPEQKKIFSLFLTNLSYRKMQVSKLYFCII